jgi:hypothetical protein
VVREKKEAIQQIRELMQRHAVSTADLMQPVTAPEKVTQVHITGGRWIEELSPTEWAARGAQGERPSDTYEMEFDTPLAVAPDGTVWAWIGPSVEILPDRAGA